MDLGFNLVFLAVIGDVLAMGAAIELAGATFLLTRGLRARTILVICAAALPFVSLAWLAGVFVVQASINEFFLDRDSGVGDSWYCSLRNGYSVNMIDITDQGFIVPKNRAWPTIH